MKKNDLRDALSGINKDYIAESNNFKSVAADFGKEKKQQNRVVVSLLCLALVCVGVIGISQSGLLKRDLQAVEKNSSTISSAKSNTADSESSNNATIVTSEQTAERNSSTIIPTQSNAVDSASSNNAAIVTSEQPAVNERPVIDNDNNIIWANQDVCNFEEGFTQWRNFNSVGYRLYDALESGEKDDVFAILARPAIDYTFEFKGKTLAEYYSEMCNERNLPDLLSQLRKEGDALKYGKALYETGTPTGEKWAQSLYEERVEYYGNTILEKYIVNGEFLREKLEQDIVTATNSNEATKYYNTALEAYLSQLAASIHGQLPTETVPEQNCIIMYLTKDEFSVFSVDKIEGWTFDLAVKDGEAIYQYGVDE